MRIHERQIHRVARITRPLLNSGIPLVRACCKRALKLIYGGYAPGELTLVTQYDGNLLNIDLSSSLEYNLLFRGTHEERLAAFMNNIVRPGDVCIDVGANVGIHTLRLSNLVGPEGTVIALEPHPEICARLKRNITLNNRRNVVIVNAALADSDGAATLHTFAPGAYHQGVSSLLPNSRSPDRISVQTISGMTLERYFELAECKLVKIDVEGFEPIVLNELRELIDRCAPYLIFEYRAARWEQTAEAPVTDLLAKLRLRSYEIYFSKRRTVRPVEADALPPGSCDIICIPRDRPFQRRILHEPEIPLQPPAQRGNAP